MSAPILVTKFFVPPLRKGMIERQGLINRMNDGLDRKLTLISAPAGFGKTTLISLWIENLRQEQAEQGESCRFAWLSLDEADNDLIHFLNYFILAIKQSQKDNNGYGDGALTLLQSSPSPSASSILIPLINETAAVHEKIIFVLDDFHMIEEQSIHQAMIFLIDNLPPQLHLVIATRQDPFLSLSRLRAQNQLTELRAADLRFSPAETADFLNRVMGLNLSAQDISDLEMRTEGWIAGLQLAAISMQRHEDRRGFIRSFSGGHRLVLDFLIEEVLSQQTEAIQAFLMYTSILNQFSAPLCNFLTNQDNSQEIIEMLERSNMFIIPLDNERKWYRYHHLFADLLNQRLRQSQPEKYLALHTKASEWYFENRMYNQAIDHALRGNEYDRSAHLIADQIDGLWKRGEHEKLRNWLDVLPHHILIDFPLLGAVHAYYHFTKGQNEAGQQLLDQVEKKINDNQSEDVNNLQIDRTDSQAPHNNHIRGRIFVLQSLIDSNFGNVQGMINHATKALEHLPEDDLTWRNITLFALGDAYSFQGDMDASWKTRSEAVKACEAVGDPYYIIMANLKLSTTYRELGELDKTIDICQAQIKTGEKFGLETNSSIGYLMTLWGEILAEKNDLPAAIKLVRKGVKITEHGSNIMIIGFAYLNLMRVLLSSEDLASAEEIISKVKNLAAQTTIPTWLPGQMAIWQARVWLKQGKREAAHDWAIEQGFISSAGIHLPDEFHFHSMFAYIISARILLAMDRFKDALKLLEHLSKAARDNRRISSLIEIMLLQALAFKAVDEDQHAMNTLAEAIHYAEPKGFIRIFVDEGQPMAQMLYDSLNHGTRSEYVQQLLSAFPGQDPGQDRASVSQGNQSELVEPLSDREIEVLRLVAKGLTNQVIAQRLYLSIHTIKTHTRNIYGKLGVNNRTQAVNKARTLGILPPL